MYAIDLEGLRNQPHALRFLSCAWGQSAPGSSSWNAFEDQTRACERWPRRLVDCDPADHSRCEDFCASPLFFPLTYRSLGGWRRRNRPARNLGQRTSGPGGSTSHAIRPHAMILHRLDPSAHGASGTRLLVKLKAPAPRWTKFGGGGRAFAWPVW
ncbi:hypothetical protein BC628DRAFT_112766 [Trametes gibbosa]|nr:hypothetical protein BC628DRAFT_612879 [Trametes gibbosa]KAI0828328.1 hypothetical protein BC628DRAFT_112766 [Trametes gibbosa]